MHWFRTWKLMVRNMGTSWKKINKLPIDRTISLLGTVKGHHLNTNAIHRVDYFYVHKNGIVQRIFTDMRNDQDKLSEKSLYKITYIEWFQLCKKKERAQKITRYQNSNLNYIPQEQKSWLIEQNIIQKHTCIWI